MSYADMCYVLYTFTVRAVSSMRRIIITSRSHYILAVYRTFCVISIGRNSRDSHPCGSVSELWQHALGCGLSRNAEWGGDSSVHHCTVHTEHTANRVNVPCRVRRPLIPRESIPICESGSFIRSRRACQSTHITHTGFCPGP